MAISRRKFIQGLIGAGAAGSAAYLWSRDTPFPEACRLTRLEVPGPAGWAGRRALFVTDVHYGNFFGPKEAAALDALVRAQKPNLVLLGGDLAQAPETDLGGFFSAWKPGCPTLFAPGNHDTAGLDGDVLPQARAAGLTVLCNESETWDGIRFVGLPSALQARQRRSLLAGGGFTVVLGHEPDMWDHYAEPDLLHLAGHTHGGQIRLFGHPLGLPTLGRKYPLGRFSRDGNRSLYVSAGIGCVDVRARINCPPELLRIDFA